MLFNSNEFIILNNLKTMILEKATLLPPLSKCSLFLDFDGTIVNIASSPSDVTICNYLVKLLHDIYTKTDKRLAIITGREIYEIDNFLSPLKLPIAGIHGLETRYNGEEVSRESNENINNIRESIKKIKDKFPNTIIEDKFISLSIHYRNCPEHSEEILKHIEEYTFHLCDLDIMKGKMVYEIKPKGIDKGTSIKYFSSKEKFYGYTPIYFGDDVTDENAFMEVNKRKGISIHVGNKKDTNALYRVPDVASVHKILMEWSDCEF